VCRSQQLALAVLVARRLCGVDGVPFAVQPFRDGGCNDRRVVIHAHDGVDGMFTRKHVRGVGGALGMLEVEGEETGRVRGFERAGPLRGNRQLRADAPSGFKERCRTIRRGR
jgi:hypothetical protein